MNPLELQVLAAVSRIAQVAARPSPDTTRSSAVDQPSTRDSLATHATLNHESDDRSQSSRFS